MLIGMMLRVPTLADETKHPTDIWLEKALAKNSSTTGTRQATNKAREMWDAEMNKRYRRLMSALKPRQRAALRKSQKAWLAFRDAEFAANETIISSKQGTMWPMMADDRMMILVKERALHLQGYEEAQNDR